MKKESSKLLPILILSVVFLIILIGILFQSFQSSSSRASENLLTSDPFQLTATSIVANVTLVALYSPTPCETYQLNKVSFYYSAGNGLNWEEMPNIVEQMQSYCVDYNSEIFSHEIIIDSNRLITSETMIHVLEDFINRLPDYPPDDHEAGFIRLLNIEIIPFEYGRFSYSEAMTAFNSGLRGTDLLESLGIEQP